MKTKNEISTAKTVIDKLRDIRDRVSLEVQDLNAEQLKDFLNKKEMLHQAHPWQKQG